MKRILAVLLAAAILLTAGSTAQAKIRLSDTKRDRVDRIYEVVRDHYEEYGVWPSVCLAQAVVESGLGEACRGNNLWGIASGAEYYSSLEAGVIRYLSVINNGYYRGAPFAKTPEAQLERILDGGYCQPVGAYYGNAMWAIDTYEFKKYDERLKRWLKKKAIKKRQARLKRRKAREMKERLAKQNELKLERVRRQKELIRVSYDGSLFPWQVDTDRDLVSGGTLQISYSFYEVARHTATGNNILTGDRNLAEGWWFLSAVFENAVG